MQYLSAAEAAKKWKISERSVRNYCAKGRVEGAVLKGKTWKIPADAEKPQRATLKLQRRKLCWRFCSMKRLPDTAAVFTIKRRLK
mgnify:CR=1 FL=1